MPSFDLGQFVSAKRLNICTANIKMSHLGLLHITSFFRGFHVFTILTLVEKKLDFFSLHKNDAKTGKPKNLCIKTECIIGLISVLAIAMIKIDILRKKRRRLNSEF